MPFVFTGSINQFNWQMVNMARPAFKITKGHKEKCLEAASHGLNEEQIAEQLKIAYKTFRNYKKHFLPFIKKGREQYLESAVPLVENALLKRCVGYNFEEIKTESKDGTITTTITKKHVPPDPGSVFFFLCNKASHRWKNPLRIEAPAGIENKEIPVAEEIKAIAQ